MGFVAGFQRACEVVIAVVSLILAVLAFYGFFYGGLRYGLGFLALAGVIGSPVSWWRQLKLWLVPGAFFRYASIGLLVLVL